ncbi:transcriptional regulator [Arachnia propionica]|uniref:Transcriptional regulator n=1 Tax=Arachnia propionica TaxID=1750 RepID=A0A3P1T4J4_9ACTN|nr:helix-turn-helix domain-containing protein [Arachnia propionica]MDO5083611.1 helix-turn-helix domain-containing protein [Arachnia propionica]RRD04270.1 transcriptional regulator [Arachnia propionica]
MPTSTAAQRRESEKRAFDAYLANCPSQKLFARISTKWTMLVLCRLGDSSTPLRSAELHRQLAGASQKMLTETLRNLEADGLVNRSVVATVPVSVSYHLTELGRSLLEAILPLKQWAEDNYELIEAAREQQGRGDPALS